MNFLEMKLSRINSIIREVLGDFSAQVLSYQIAPIAHRITNGVTGGVYRICCSIQTSGGTRKWSAVVKIIQANAGSKNYKLVPSTDPNHWNYWQREVLFYQSDLAAEMTGFLRVPQCFNITTEEQQCELWLEDIYGQPASQWSPQQYGFAAYHLGLVQGKYLAGCPLPHYLWLGQTPLNGADFHWLQHSINSNAQIPKDLSSALTHLFQETMIDISQRVSNRKSEFLQVIEKLPRTLSHFDFQPSNMFSELDEFGRTRTVVLDWSYVSNGVLGEDVASLILLSSWMLNFDADLLPIFEKFVIDGYHCGLSHSGYTVPIEFVWSAYATVAVLRFGLLMGYFLEQTQCNSYRDNCVKRFARNAEYIFKQRYKVIRHALCLEHYAYKLLD